MKIINKTYKSIAILLAALVLITAVACSDSVVSSETEDTSSESNGSSSSANEYSSSSVNSASSSSEYEEISSSAERTLQISGVSGTMHDVFGSIFEGAILQCGSDKDTTDQWGKFSFQVTSYDENPVVTFSKEGYDTDTFTFSFNVFHEFSVLQKHLVGNPVITDPNQWRIVVGWDYNPSDLDAHLVTPNGTHISKEFDDSGDDVTLDKTDNNDNGPETITINTLNTTGSYKFYVEKVSAGENPLYRSNAIVKVYNSTGLAYKFELSSEEVDGFYWNVFEIVDGTLIEKNYIQETSPLDDN